MRILSILSLSLLLVQLQAQVEQLTLLDHWKDSTLVGSSQFDNAYNEIWGHATEENEYAIIGTTEGTHFIDVTDPENIFEAHFIEGDHTGPAIIHRDYHDYKNFLFAVSDEGAGSLLQIMDLNHLPDSVPVAYSSGDVLRRAHNIFIDETKGYLYVLIARGGVASFDPMRIYDISDPTNPIHVNSYSTIEGIGFGQVHDAYIDNDTAFLNLGPGGLLIADFTDKTNPIALSSLAPSDYPDAGYNHSGWPSEDKQFYYFADENWGHDLKVLDIRDINNANIEGVFNAEDSSEFSIAHNQVVACDYLYVSYYYNGIQVFDISDPSNPIRSFHYPTASRNLKQNYEGAWGVYPFLPSGNILVSDMQEGLFVFDALDTECNLVTSTKEVNSKQVNVYPNPSQNLLHVELNKPAKFSIYNSTGILVKSGNYENNSSGISFDLLNGIYFIQLKNEDGLFTTSFQVLK